MLDGEWWDVEVVHPDDYGDVLPPHGRPGGPEAPAAARGYADPDIGGGRTVVGAVPPVPGMIMVQYYADATERWWVRPQSELRPRVQRNRGDLETDFLDRMCVGHPYPLSPAPCPSSLSPAHRRFVTQSYAKPVVVRE